MKKQIGLVLLFFCTSITLFGQATRTAKQILDEVSKKYDTYKTIQSEFTFSSTQSSGERYTDKGTLFLNKQKSQYRIQLANQDLLSDGVSSWSILHEEKEVQISPIEETSASIGPNNIFTFYKNGYNYALGKDEKFEKNWLKVIELIPSAQQTNYSKIKIRINQNNHIHDVLVFDKSGAQFSYLINTLFVNHPISSTKFIFDKSKYSSYEIVDLR